MVLSAAFVLQASRALPCQEFVAQVENETELGQALRNLASCRKVTRKGTQLVLRARILLADGVMSLTAAVAALRYQACALFGPSPSRCLSG